MKPERCRLARTVFLGAIKVTNSSKSEKKNAHKKKHEMEGCKKMGGGKKWPAAGIYRCRNTSRFAPAKGPFAAAKTYFTATKGSLLRRRTEPCSVKGDFIATDLKVWS